MPSPAVLCKWESDYDADPDSTWSLFSTSNTLGVVRAIIFSLAPIDLGTHDAAQRHASVFNDDVDGRAPSFGYGGAVLL